MESCKEKQASPQSERYYQAEQAINQAIAGMSSEMHIEYGSTLERKNKVNKWRQLRQWLKRKSK